MNCKKYIDRLKELQEDRSKFEKEKDKNNYSHKLNKQEYKYQAYIIDQMNDKNRLIATTRIRDTLAHTIKTGQTGFLRKLASYFIVEHAACNDIVTSMQSLRQQKSRFNSREDTMNVDLILVKLCTETIKRQLDKAIVQIKKDSFNILIRYCKKKVLLQKIAKNTQKYHQRHTLKAIIHFAAKLKSQKKITTEGKIFDESFSVIIKNDGLRKQRGRNMQESYLSMIMDKENMNSDCVSCKQSVKIAAQQHEQIGKLKEELAFLKTLLSEKTLEIKKSTQQCEKIRQYYEGQQQECSRLQEQYSDIHSRNSSFLSEMERQVFGGKRIKKNGNQGSTSQLSNRSQTSRQLLGKYMKESFQMKQTMDIARQACIQLQQRLRGQERRQIGQVIRMLNANNEEGVDDV